MPRDSQGDFTNTYNWVQDAANGINIEPDRHQDGDDDQAQGLTDSLDRQGRGGMNADLAMGNNKVTQVNEGTVSSDAPNIGQIQDGAFSYSGTDLGAADAYVVSLSPTITSYKQGLTLSFKPANSNTGASTLQVDGVVPAPAIKWQSLDLVANTIKAGVMVTVRYDGTDFIMINSPEILQVEYGGTGQNTSLGTAANADIGTAEGNVAALDANRVFAPEQQGIIGQITEWSTGTAPNTWLFCDGASYDTTTQATLFGVIGYTYGGAGASFNVPDMRGRSPTGVGAVDGTGTPRALADKFGAETHTQTIAEMPSHDHQAGLGDNNITAPHGTEGTQPNRYTTQVQTSNEFLTGDRGGGDPFNILSPALTVNFIIKAGYPA